MLRQSRKKFGRSFVLSLDKFIKVAFHFLTVFLLVSFHGLLVQLLVESWVVCVHVNLVLAETQTFLRFLVKDYIEFNLIVPAFCSLSKHWVDLHLLPSRPHQRISLHCFV